MHDATMRTIKYLFGEDKEYIKNEICLYLMYYSQFIHAERT